MSNKVFIIGNGFDLDLGLNTRYSDFAKSDKWPFTTTHLPNSLAGYLKKKANVEKWFDLEKELLLYSQNRIGAERALARYKTQAENDKRMFDDLNQSLTAYLKREERTELKKDSVAAKVLLSIIESDLFSSIYSFNYTDLHNIAAQLGSNKKFEYEHVHGCLKENSIILGVEEGTDLLPGYQYLYKTFNPHYESHYIQYDMLEADEVVFFGHSLGHNDYHYFQMFFQEQCRDGMKRKDGKRITIFTYNDSSRIEILEQLRQMNNKKTDLLFNLNQMEVIYTKDGGGYCLERFINRLKEEANSLDNFMQNGIY